MTSSTIAKKQNCHLAGSWKGGNKENENIIVYNESNKPRYFQQGLSAV
ncbi:hypothetical protein KKI91_20550 [Xenorhabdus bovienii]|nr:hypothetical protein [Xenorhabdus bovienii]